jgi:hypothetical protein
VLILNYLHGDYLLFPAKLAFFSSLRLALFRGEIRKKQSGINQQP